MPAWLRTQPQSSHAIAPVKRKAAVAAPTEATRTRPRKTAVVRAPDVTKFASNAEDESEDGSDAEVVQLLTPGRTRLASPLGDSHAAGPSEADMYDLGDVEGGALDGTEDEPELQSDGAARARLDQAAPSGEPSSSDSETATPKRQRKAVKSTYSSKSKAKAREAADLALEPGTLPAPHGSTSHSALSAESWEADFADEFEEDDLAPNDGPEAAATARNAVVAADDARQRKRLHRSPGADSETDDPHSHSDASDASDESDDDVEDPRDRLNRSPDTADVLFLRWDKSSRAAKFWLAPEEYWGGVPSKTSGRKRKLPQRDSRSRAAAAIKKYRSTLVDDKDFRKADFVVLPPGRWEGMAHFFDRAKRYQLLVVTSLYIAEAVRDVRRAKRGDNISTLCDYKDYVINFVPRRLAAYHPFTTEEKFEFAKKLGTHGSAAYGIMARKFPHHSKESWRNHYQTVNTVELDLLVEANDLARKKASSSRSEEKEVNELDRDSEDELDRDSEDKEELELMLHRERGAPRLDS